MNVSLWGIRNPLPATLLFVLLCAVGMYGFRLLPIGSLPDITLPTVEINVGLPGASATVLETEVTRRIEDSVASLSDIEKIVSLVAEGRSTTRIDFVIGRDMTDAVDEVRDAVNRIRNELPQDIDEPVISRRAILGGAVVTFALESERLAPDELSWFIDDTVARTVFAEPGVGQVSRIGGVDREVRVNLRGDVLQSWGVTAGAVSQQLARLQLERPGGRTRSAGASQSVRTVARVSSIDELRDYPISLPDGRSVRLSALAEVVDGAATPTSAARLNGRSVIAVGVSRTRESSEVGVGKAVRARMQALQAAHPEIKFTEVASTVEDAENSYKSSMTMLLEGALLAVLVVWLFLRDWRATWISAVALPLSVIPTFGVMYLFGFSLNLLTLLALAIVVGILVDDAIVEVENVARHRAMGKSPMQAAIDATDEIGIAVIATSVTLAAVFLPVAFISGTTGKFFREFGWTAAASVLFSLLVARLLTPMMAAYLMRSEPRPVPDTPLLRRYLGWVEWALDHRRATLLAALGSFVLSMALIPFIPKTFLPPDDSLNLQLDLQLAPGATLDETITVAEESRQRIVAMPEVAGVFVSIGGSPVGATDGGIALPEPRNATLSIDIRSGTDRSQQELEDEVRTRLSNVAGIRYSFASFGPGDKIDLVLAGRDSAQLTAASLALVKAIRTVPGIGTVESSASLLQPEVVIRADAARAADLGVSTLDIADAARIATSGDFRHRLAKLELTERQIPIRVQLADAEMQDIEMLRRLRVPGSEGPVPLAAVADIVEASAPASINRQDRERNVKVSAELNGLPLGEVLDKVLAMPEAKNLPAGVRLLPSGDAEAFVELFLGFVFALLAGVAAVYLVLLLLFHNAVLPIVILAAVPLCGGGAFGALLLTGQALCMPSLIGLLLLTGIATKNSILIVDYAIIGESEGMSRRKALIEACRKRVRPVIMTSLAMGAGMLPLSLGLGADGNFRVPLGVAVLGGLVTSTLLSLVVVPAAYSVAADWSDRWRQRRRALDVAPAAT